MKKCCVQGCPAPPLPSPALTPPTPTPSPPLMMFFPPGVQRLSCPQHVLVLGSSAARTCDDRVYEQRGVSGVKCVYRGAVARWKHTLPPGSQLRGATGCIYWQRKKHHIQGGLLTDKLCSFYCVFFQLCTFNCVCKSQETGTSGTNQHVEDAPGNQLVMRFKLQTCSC